MEEDCGMARQFAVMFSPPLTHRGFKTNSHSEEAKPLVLIYFLCTLTVFSL